MAEYDAAVRGNAVDVIWRLEHFAGPTPQVLNAALWIRLEGRFTSGAHYGRESASRYPRDAFPAGPLGPSECQRR